MWRDWGKKSVINQNYHGRGKNKKNQKYCCGKTKKKLKSRQKQKRSENVQDKRKRGRGKNKKKRKCTGQKEMWPRQKHIYYVKVRLNVPFAAIIIDNGDFDCARCNSFIRDHIVERSLKQDKGHFA